MRLAYGDGRIPYSKTFSKMAHTNSVELWLEYDGCWYKCTQHNRLYYQDMIDVCMTPQDERALFNLFMECHMLYDNKCE